VAVASKVVSTCEGRVIELEKVRVTPTAKRLAKRYEIDERLTAIVIGESDQIFGGVRGFLLTLTDGILSANAGVDVKNAPPNTAILWPKNPDLSARKLRKDMERRYHTRLGVEVVDSRVTPLRLGTVGLAIGLSGFSPIRDDRDKLDLYGRSIRVTQTNVADDLAAMTHVIMGEAKERVGVVLVRNAPVTLGKSANSKQTKMSRDKCLIGSSLRKASP